MNNASLSSVIRYYKSCYQASFFSGLGYGLFDQTDVQPLAVLAGSPDDEFSLDEDWIRQYLIDEDQLNLVLIENLIVIPEPNNAATTDVHYIPDKVYSLNDWATGNATTRKQEPDLTMQLLANDRKVKDIDIPKNLPSPNGLVRWLTSQMSQTASLHRLQLSIVVLVPKNFKAGEHKADFVAQVDLIAKNHKNPDSLLSQLFLNKKSSAGVDESPSDLPFLSVQQNSAVNRAYQHKISLIKGPPGTGKSYTLASLAAHLAGHGKSVLLTSHSDHALTVLKNKLTDNLGVDANYLVHIGPGRRAGRLSQQLNRLASTRTPDNRDVADKSLRSAWANFKNASTSLSKAIHQQPNITVAQLAGEPGFYGHLKQLFWRLSYKEAFTLNRQVLSLHETVDHLKSAFFQQVHAVLVGHFNADFKENNRHWSSLITGLKKKSMRSAVLSLNHHQQSRFSPSTGLRIWLIKLDEIPEHAFGLFDSVIIDEATQANMAEVLPAIAMARQAIVAGDPRQLRHYSFLSYEQEKRIAQSLELNPGDVVSYRDTSFLDFVESYLVGAGQVDAITTLDEHYRSAPPLMDFNSKTFYDGGVQVLTGVQDRNGPCLHLNWRYLDGDRVDKINQVEAAAVIDELMVIIEQQRNWVSSKKSTLGVLSFFRDQTEYLKKEILNQCSLNDIKAHKIKIGTPFSFQGEERDHMLISCAIDNNTHHGTWGYLNQPDVFNVATSRARSRQTLFLSVEPKNLPNRSVLRAYHEFSLERAPVIKGDHTQMSWYLTLLGEFRKAGFNVTEDQRIAEIPIDLIMTLGDLTVAIDLIGFPGDVGDAVHLSRYQALHRAGIPLFPLTAKEWLVSPENVIAQLMSWVSSRRSLLTLDAANKPPQTETIRDLSLLPDDVWQRVINTQQAPEIISEFGKTVLMLDQLMSQISQLLGILFSPGSITYLRYQSTIHAVLKKYLDNLDTFSLLHAQVWESASNDHGYWRGLVAPIKERHREYQTALVKLQEKLQLQVASQSTDNFDLKDLEHLADRLKDYD